MGAFEASVQYQITDSCEKSLAVFVGVATAPMKGKNLTACLISRMCFKKLNLKHLLDALSFD